MNKYMTQNHMNMLKPLLAVHREVGELRGLLISLAEREVTVEQEVFSKNYLTLLLEQM